MAEMDTPAASSLERGRGAFARQAWAEALDALTAADRDADRATTLAPEDLERLAAAAYLAGHDAAYVDPWTRAHHGHLQRGDAPAAARCAIWLGFKLLTVGEMAPAAGWLARAARLLDECGRDCVERGYLLVPTTLRHVFEGDAAAAHATFGEAVAIGRRFADADLVARARHGEGRALIRLGRVAEGVTLLDEAMVSVTAGEVSPLVAGDVYCSVIEACHALLDLRRAQEWTAALGRRCAAQPDALQYRGSCLVRRAEILQLHRLRGELAKAEQAYREAGERGLVPQPGLALLRLAQGETDAATAAIRRALDETREPARRSAVLAATVDVMLAAGRRPPRRAAREGCDGRAGQARPAHRARAAGARPRRDRADQPRHRRGPRAEREDRGAPREQHLPQARPVEPVRRHGVRLPPRPGLTRGRLHRITHRARPRRVDRSPEAEAPRVPAFAAALDPAVVQLHSADYRNPSPHVAA